MANKIRGFTQIQAGSIYDAQLNASAAIALSKLAELVIQADGGQNFTGAQSMNGNRLTGVPNTPLDGQDAVNANYVDDKLDNVDRKESCRSSSTQDLTLETFGTGGVTYANGTAGVGATLTQDVAANGAFGGLDGVTAGLATGQRIVIQHQATAAENGIYEITTLGDGATIPWVLTRTTDADSIAELHAGTLTFVREGGTLGGNTFQVISAVTIIGTSDVDWTQTSGVSVTIAGAGLTKDGNTIDVESANAGILVNTNDIELQVDPAATIAIGGAGIQVADATAGDLLIGQGGGTDTAFVTVTGDVSISAAGVTAITTGVILDADVNAAAAIALSKLASGTDAQMIVASGAGVPTYVAISGDATIANTGAVTLATNVLKEADVVTRETPTGTIDGTTGTDGNAVFTLLNTPIVGTVTVTVNGVEQEEGTAPDSYTISGAVITFNATWVPVTGDTLRASYLK